MHTHHRVLTLDTHSLHLVTFDAATFDDRDMLWLPHYRQLQHAGRKRKTEHLAGRIAAVHGLREHNLKTVPGISDTGAPCWPQDVFGSISHCGNQALAVVGRTPLGVDIETLFTEDLCHELTSGIVTPAEQAVLTHATLPFSLALTLAFSAKESLFKALSFAALPFPGFHSAQVISLNQHVIRLRIDATFSHKYAGKSVNIAWIMQESHVVTLLVESPSGS